MTRCQDIYTAEGRKQYQQCEQQATNGTPWCGPHQKYHQADIMRMRGLRTVAKPGDPDYKASKGQ